MTTISSVQWLAMSNSMHNGNVGDVVNTMEDKALEYAQANNISKDEALDILVEQYKENTNYDFYEDVQTYSKDIKSDFLAGFVDGLDFLNLFNTTSTQQALNDLANIEPSGKENLGRAIGGAIATGVVGLLFGGGIGLAITKAAKALSVGGAIIGSVAGGGFSIAKSPAEKNDGEASFTPVVTAQPTSDTTVEEEKTTEEDKEETVLSDTGNPFDDEADDFAEYLETV